MPTYDEVKTVLASSDAGLLFLILMLVVASVASVKLLQYRAIYRQLFTATSHFYLPITTVVFNPLLAVATFALSHIQLRFPPLVWICLLSIPLRLILFGQSLWYDEAFTIRMAALDWSMWPDAIINDVHPPTFYALVKVFADLGISDQILRMVPLLFGVLQIVLVYRLTKSLSNENTARFAALVTALLPGAIYYSTELRSYTGLVCLYLIAVIGIVERKPRWILFSTALLPALHWFGFIYSGVVWLVALRSNRNWWRYGMLACLVMGAWLPLPIYQYATIADGYFPYFVAGTFFQPFLYMTLVTLSDAYIVATVVPVIIITLFAMWRGRSNLNGLILLPLTIVAIISIISTPIFVPRTFYPAMMLLPVAWSILLKDSQRWQMFLLAVLVVGSFAFLQDANDNTRVPYAQLVAQHCGEHQLYATSIPAAFVLAANTASSLVVWDQATDDAGTFTHDDLPRYGFNVLPSPPVGINCIMHIDQPLTSQHERVYLTTLNDVQLVSREQVSRWHVLYFYLVETES